MIPNGVHRIISAIAPNPEMREAMLGDLDEEWRARAGHGGTGAANRWCWGEAIRSLFAALRHSVPSLPATFTSVLPAMLWGATIAFFASLAVVLATMPLSLIEWFDMTEVMLGISIFARVSTSIMGGYEAARVGAKAPLWSALASGLFPSAVLCTIAALTIIPARVGTAVIISALANLLLVPGSLFGGILYQAQRPPTDSLSSPG